MQNLRQAHALHVRTEITGANEIDVRMLDGHIVAHRTFGDEHDLFGFFFADMLDHAGRRTDKIGFGEDIRRALGVSNDMNAGIIPPITAQFFGL